MTVRGTVWWTDICLQCLAGTSSEYPPWVIVGTVIISIGLIREREEEGGGAGNRKKINTEVEIEVR